MVKHLKNKLKKKEKKTEALEVLKPEETKEGIFPKEMRNDEIKNEVYEIKKWENKIRRKDLKYEANKYAFDFQRFKTTRSLGESIYNGKINIDESEMKQTNLLENIMDFSNKSRPRSKKEKHKK